VRAIAFAGGRAVVVERPDPVPAPGEAVVRVRLAGICGTDLEIARGYMGFAGIPGHEFVGVVESSPDPAWVGRRVVGEINAACGRCETCARGLGRHCPSRTVLGILGRDGAFAERLRLPLANLREVPAAVPDEAAVFCEPLAAAWEVLEQVVVPAGSRTAVLGAGRLGQLCARVLARAGAPPLVLGRSEGKLALARAAGLEAARADAAIERGFDLVIEATGSPQGLARALALVRPRGTIVLKSTYHGSAPIALAPVVIDEITIVGSRCGRFEPALAHLAADPALVAGLRTACFALDDAASAFALASDRASMKVLLAP
jgi:threonine dehydrogenase-like Zn-dependent dehydrogenase